VPFLLRDLVLQVGQPGAQFGITGLFGAHALLLSRELLARLDQPHQQLVEAARELGAVGHLTLVGQAGLVVQQLTPVR
jgi:ABC-type spermidine/putrescine transport system permease subunit II